MPFAGANLPNLHLLWFQWEIFRVEDGSTPSDFQSSGEAEESGKLLHSPPKIGTAIDLPALICSWGFEGPLLPAASQQARVMRVLGL